MKYLVEFKKDWADEFYVYGLAIMTQEECESLRLSLPYLTCGFGSNQGWKNEGDFDASDFHFRLIGENEEKLLRGLIKFSDYYGFPRWGQFPDFQDVAHDIIYNYSDDYDYGISEESVKIMLQVMGREVTDSPVKEQAKAYVESVNQ